MIHQPTSITFMSHRPCKKMCPSRVQDYWVSSGNISIVIWMNWIGRFCIVLCCLDLQHRFVNAAHVLWNNTHTPIKSHVKCVYEFITHEVSCEIVAFTCDLFNFQGEIFKKAHVHTFVILHVLFCTGRYGCYCIDHVKVYTRTVHK